ncbi:MAG: sn-glycerol-1-phosphate dehydrogenase [Halanaerobiales bacterium]
MLEKILNSTFECECGKKHHIDIKRILIEVGALAKLPSLLSNLTSKKKFLIISDLNTHNSAGRKAEVILTKHGYQVKELILKDKNVIPNPNNLFKILKKITKKEYILACGSGTINDLTGYASYKTGQPYSVIATAPSMDGYASAVSSITAEGIKQTYNTNPAEAIIADIEVLRKAPKKLIQAGYGDLLGKTTSLMDWKLAKLLFSEYYCNKAAEIIENELDNIIRLAQNSDYREPKNIESLIKGLIYSGLAMQMVGSSRPASGSEHHISHFIEMFAKNYVKKMPLHGTKVGMATLFTTSLYLILKDIDFESINLNIDKKKRANHIKKAYGNRSEPILSNLEKRWDKEYLTKSDLLKSKKIIISLIKKDLKTIKKSREILQEHELFNQNIVKEIPRELLEKALKYGFEIRARYTITTLMNQIGELDNIIDRLLNRFYD